jgi:hypothetical protein
LLNDNKNVKRGEGVKRKEMRQKKAEYLAEKFKPRVY